MWSDMCARCGHTRWFHLEGDYMDKPIACTWDFRKVCDCPAFVTDANDKSGFCLLLGEHKACDGRVYPDRACACDCHKTHNAD